MSIKYSVIIPTYNRETILREVLESIYKNQYKNFEVIIVIDGSTDKTEEMLKTFPCKIIKHEQSKKVCISRNAGAKLAIGDYLVFLDDDLLVPQNMFEIFDNVFETKKEYSILFGPFSPNQRFTNFASNFKNLYMHYSFYNLPDRVYHIIGGSAVIKRSIFEEFKGFDENYQFPYGEDHELGLRIGLKYPVFRCKDFQPEHIKHYKWTQVLKCDFDRSLALIRFILRSIFLKKNKILFSHSTPNGYNRASPILIFLIVIFSLLTLANLNFIWGAFVTFFLTIILNFGLLFYFYSQKGFLFFIKSCLFIFLDITAVSIGIVYGISSFILGDRRY